MITMALKYTSNWKWSYKSEQSLMNANVKECEFPGSVIVSPV